MGDENRGKADAPLSAVRARKEALPVRRRMAAISPSTPFRIGHRRIDGVGNRPPFSAIFLRGRAAWIGAGFPRTPHRTAEIAGIPRHLTGPFRTARAAKDDFTPSSYTHEGAGASDSWRWCGEYGTPPHLVAGERADGDLCRLARRRVNIVP